MPSGFSIFLFFICAASFAGFGIYSVLYFYLKQKNPTKYLKRWDADACTIVLTSGIVYTALWLSEVTLFYMELKPEFQPRFINAISGPQSFWFWLPPLFYFAFSQLFWIPRLRELIVARLVAVLFLFIGFSRLASFAGAHFPEFSFGWQLKPEYMASGYLFLDYLLKTVVFLALVGTVYVLRNRQK